MVSNRRIPIWIILIAMLTVLVTATCGESVEPLILSPTVLSTQPAPLPLSPMPSFPTMKAQPLKDQTTLPATAAPTWTPIPTLEPLLWVGPLLYPGWDLEYLGQASIPIFDLGREEARQVPTKKKVHYVLDWSPDGCYATYVHDRQVRVINIVTLQDRLLFSIPESAPIGPRARVRYSPAGDWIAYSPMLNYYQDQVYLVRPNGTENIQLTDSAAGNHVYGWLSDGQQILYWSHQKKGELGWEGIWRLKLLDIKSKRALTVAQFSQPLESWEQLVITDVNTLQVVPLEMGDEPEDVLFVELVWTPDFHHFALFTAQDFGPETYNSTQLYLIKVASGQMQRVNETPFLLNDMFSLSPDGTSLIFGARYFDEQSVERFETFLLDMVTGELGVLGQELDHDLWMPSWSPDGKKISFMDAGGRAIYDLDTEEFVRLPDTFTKYYWPLYWSPQISYGPGVCQNDTRE